MWSVLIERLWCSMEGCWWSASTSGSPHGATPAPGDCPIAFLVSHDLEISIDDFLNERVDVVRISLRVQARHGGALVPHGRPPSHARQIESY